MTTTSNIPRIAPPQAFISSYAPRLRAYANALLTPIAPPPTTVLPPVRTTKRGTTAINYAEDGFGSDFDEDADNARRPTGLRSRRDDFGSHAAGRDRTALGGGSGAAHQGPQYGKEARGPVKVQGIWRDWMGKSKPVRTEKQALTQTILPLHLIPMRIDVDIQPFRPEAPLPAPPGSHLNDMLSAYRAGELTPGFRLKDMFLWNLHEALLTPEHFAKVFVDEMDVAVEKRGGLTMEIARQIREQLETHAATALHPLFQISNTREITTQQQAPQQTPENNATVNGTAPIAVNDHSNGQTPLPPTVTAIATQSQTAQNTEHTNNPDDTYRCILTLSIPHQTHLYTDRFEWSLLHPPGHAETFARLTTADLGLPSEWAPSIAHAIYEAVLRLKKEAAENNGQVMGFGTGAGTSALLFSTGDGTGGGVGGGLGLENDAVREEGAGWRYDPDGLGKEWEPKVEMLSKEEIEKREGDRERRLRRARRETARMAGVSSTAAADYTDPHAGGGGGGRSRGRLTDYGGIGVGPGDSYSNYNSRGGGAGTPDVEDESQQAQMGRGHRSKKKRRFRSLSPEKRGTPDPMQSSATAGIGVLSDNERNRFRCAHCQLPGSAVWAVRDGPEGPNSLCQICGWFWDKGARTGLPSWNEGLFVGEGVTSIGRR